MKFCNGAVVLVVLGVIASSDIVAGVPAAVLTNVSFGFDHRQIMDIYLPANRSSSTTKVVVLIHGGGWSSGSKEDFTHAVGWFWPDYAVVNMQYRLGTLESPGYPKQLQDIDMALTHLRSRTEVYQISASYALFGGSAGAHLATLYGYTMNTHGEVKVIGSYVGPIDFTDPTLFFYPISRGQILSFVGNRSLANDRELYEEASPTYHVHPAVPKTISFYGGRDYLIPSASQIRILQDRFLEAGVGVEDHEEYLYPEEGHSFIDPDNVAEVIENLRRFIRDAFISSQKQEGL